MSHLKSRAMSIGSDLLSLAGNSSLTGQMDSDSSIGALKAMPSGFRTHFQVGVVFPD